MTLSKTNVTHSEAHIFRCYHPTLLLPGYNHQIFPNHSSSILIDFSTLSIVFISVALLLHILDNSNTYMNNLFALWIFSLLLSLILCFILTQPAISMVITWTLSLQIMVTPPKSPFKNHLLSHHDLLSC